MDATTPDDGAGFDEATMLWQEAQALLTAVGERRLVLLGEKHGTREIPLLVAAVLQAEPATTARVLALELPGGQQAALDAWFASDGGASARAALRATPFWNVVGDPHDGRRSEAMRDLLARIHAQRAAGASIRVVGFDTDPGSYTDHHERDRLMAAFLHAAVASDAARWWVLTGNVHAMRAHPDDAPPAMQVPMGSVLADLAPFSVNIEAREGTTWACRMRQCGPLVLPRREWQSTPLDGGVYDYRVVLPRFERRAVWRCA